MCHSLESFSEVVVRGGARGVARGIASVPQGDLSVPVFAVCRGASPDPWASSRYSLRPLPISGTHRM